MSQTWDIDLIIPATTTPASDIQRIVDGLLALRSLFSGAAEPASADQVAYMLWADTTAGQLKIRNAANNAWIVLGTLASPYLGLLSLVGGNMTGGVNGAKTSVASTTSPDIFAATVGNLIDYTGTATATGFTSAPQAGCIRLLVCAAACAFTAGANLLIDGTPSGTTLFVSAGDTLTAVAITTTQFKLIPHRRRVNTASVAFAASLTVNTSLSEYFEVGTLTGNVTTFTLSNPSPGQTIRIRFKQDATGSRTVATPSGAKITGAISGSINVASYLTLTYSSVDSRWEGAWASVPV